MNPVLAPPSPSDTRSAIADWMELQAVGSSRGRATAGSLANVLDIAEGDDDERSYVDEETGEVLDAAILEEERSAVMAATFEELEYRQRVLGVAYPFTVDARRLILDFRSDKPISQAGQVVYLFCLLASAIRERKFHPAATVAAAESGIAAVFQICACLAAGGYINGEVASFGFPRAPGLGFLQALKDTFDRFGFGRVHTEITEGLPEKPKDGGIDVIAWRHHPDRMPGKIYLLGQCASGMGWGNKSVVEYVPQLHGSWFSEPPAEHWLPAMFIPFTLHSDISEARCGSFMDKVRTVFGYNERRFGIIFDRFRVAHFANECMAGTDEFTGRVDGIDYFDQVKSWVGDTRQLAGLNEAA